MPLAASTKTYESNFIHHNFVQFGKRHSGCKAVFAVHCFVTARVVKHTLSLLQ